MKFNDKKVIITGGASGIGKCTAIKLVQWGADVAIIDLNQNDAQRVVSDIVELRRDGLAVKTDITIYDEVADAIKKINAKFGRAYQLYEGRIEIHE